jgi:tRNA(fMet)-specific endonuclease VapC
MATPSLLIDTSIIIEHLRKQNKQKSALYNIVDNYDLYTSTIVEFELYTGATNSQKRRDVQEILAWSTVLPLTSNIAQTAATIYQQLKTKNQLIEIRDILIAATVLVNDLPLMTLNAKHFTRISGLQLLSPPQI